MMKKMLEKGEIDVDDIDFEQLDYISDFETESGGSDSSVSDGLPMQILHASMPEVVVYFIRWILEQHEF